MRTFIFVYMFLFSSEKQDTRLIFFSLFHQSVIFVFIILVSFKCCLISILDVPLLLTNFTIKILCSFSLVSWINGRWGNWLHDVLWLFCFRLCWILWVPSCRLLTEARRSLHLREMAWLFWPQIRDKNHLQSFCPSILMDCQRYGKIYHFIMTSIFLFIITIWDWVKYLVNVSIKLHTIYSGKLRDICGFRSCLSPIISTW